MTIAELVLKSRSFRRFHEDKAVGMDTMRGLIDIARVSASGANVQPLKYIVSCSPEKNALIFPHLVWAGYLTEWAGPAEGERPTAHVIILGDTEVCKSFGVDHGIAAQNILLAAAEQGLGGCMVGAIHRDSLRDALGIPERYEILLAVPMGWPKEKVVLETVGPDGNIKYYRDSVGVHHVPKRSLDEVLIG